MAREIFSFVSGAQGGVDGLRQGDEIVALHGMQQKRILRDDGLGERMWHIERCRRRLAQKHRGKGRGFFGGQVRREAVAVFGAK
jgi:hypothetical protein